jgi:uncharacterized damage-inducible protein DinB
MRRQYSNFTKPLLEEARRVVAEVYPRRIERCLKFLSEEDIWWRPNPASNSVGNLVLHLQGNVRQWIIAGLGGEADRRERDREFAETGPVARRALLAGLRKTIKEADHVLAALRAPDFMRKYSVQGYRVSGLQIVCHVAEHFAFHTGQIIFVTKLKRGEDLRFTRLPGERKSGKKMESIR